MFLRQLLNPCLLNKFWDSNPWPSVLGTSYMFTIIIAWVYFWTYNNIFLYGKYSIFSVIDVVGIYSCGCRWEGEGKACKRGQLVCSSGASTILVHAHFWPRRVHHWRATSSNHWYICHHRATNSHLWIHIW